MKVTLAAPCSQAWEGMEGDDRVRFCKACRLNVYNLSSMRERQALELVRQMEGRLCVRFFRRRDGTVLTQDCSVGRFRQWLVRGILLADALLLTVILCILMTPPGDPHRVPGWMELILDWIDPSWGGGWTAGVPSNFGPSRYWPF